MATRRTKKWGGAGEKEAINRELQLRPLYLCNPDKNADCPKTYCAFLHPEKGNCRCTINPERAKTDEDGNPIRILNADELV